jgi:hypothetical protein
MDHIYFVAYVDDGELAVEEHGGMADVLEAAKPILRYAMDVNRLDTWLRTAQVGQVWVCGNTIMVTKALPLSNTGRLRTSLED